MNIILLLISMFRKKLTEEFMEKDRNMVVPPKYIVDRRGQMYLLYDYQNHNWIFLNEDGKNIFDSIEKGMNAQGIVSDISKKYINQDSQEIANKVKQFIKYLLEMEFVFLNEYTPKPPPNLSERKGPNGCSIVFEECNLNCVYCYNKVTRTKYQNKYKR